MNSLLVDKVIYSPNHSGDRTHFIDRITPHCVAGQLSIETLGNLFLSKEKASSSNYGIGYDGSVGLFVDESKRSWCSSSSANDQRAVTIECASEKTSPFAFNDTVYSKLIELCYDICLRNGKDKLIWIGDKNSALMYKPKSNEMLITVHRWFANKSCPGDWLYSRLPSLAKEVTDKLKQRQKEQLKQNEKETYYRVQANSYKDKYLAEQCVKKLKSIGFEYAYIQEIEL